MPEWSIVQTDDCLLIQGGADARFEIELEQNDPSFFSELQENQPFIRRNLSVDDQRILEELIAAEIVVPVLQTSKALRVAVIGDQNQLALCHLKDISDAELVIIVRTNSTYSELLNDIHYPEIILPHLFVDLAYHHTLSIGPLVFPGETACIACLQGRVTNRWGDEKPPTAPKMTSQYIALATELVKAEIARIAKNDTSLTNKTVSWNFQDRSAKQDQLLKVPLCPICTQNKIDRNGALALPWGQR